MSVNLFQYVDVGYVVLYGNDVYLWCWNKKIFKKSINQIVLCFNYFSKDSISKLNLIEKIQILFVCINERLFCLRTFWSMFWNHIWSKKSIVYGVIFRRHVCPLIGQKGTSWDLNPLSTKKKIHASFTIGVQ